MVKVLYLWRKHDEPLIFLVSREGNRCLGETQSLSFRRLFFCTARLLH